REIATMRTVEEAIARQVLHGGDLATNLLELDALSEESLLWAMAASSGLEAAPLGKLPAPEPKALELVDADTAMRLNALPFALSLMNDTATLVTAAPLGQAALDDLKLPGHLKPKQVVAPLVRIREAFAKCYGVAMDRRFAKLLVKLEGGMSHRPSGSGA